ncbi:transcription termination/antitermination protein NusA, partial [Candidatus Falkowbacteria bacterium]|nr:transcription termination/antitermination protein NusA [Candidatus Falkowbacteria bacterium]
MPKSEIAIAIKQICEEKNISHESVIDTIEQALAAAYRKDFGEKNQNAKAKFDPETGKTRVFDIKTVVEDVPEEELEPESGEKSEVEVKEKKASKAESDAPAPSDDLGQPRTAPAAGGAGAGDKKTKKDKAEDKSKAKTSKDDKPSEPNNEIEEEERPKFNPRTDLQISDAKKNKKTAKIGDEIKTELKIPSEFGRMAAQTAKQVIIQRLREAERNTLLEEYKQKEGSVISGIVQRQEGALVLVDLGNATAILPPDQQIENENYNSGQRYRFYLSQVRETSKGPEIVVSRIHSEIVKQLFGLEVPEIAAGTVEIKTLSREAGSRSKVAVATSDDSIDPIGACVGQRGTRIQTIITELGGEKLDIILHNDDSVKFIANALSPAKVVSVELKEEEKIAKVKVKPDQLSLAIGKAGQNVRLAAKLTGWKIDIEEAAAPGAKSDEEKPKDEDKKSDKDSKENKETKKQENKNEDDKGEEKKTSSPAESGDAQPRTEQSPESSDSSGSGRAQASSGAGE